MSHYDPSQPAQPQWQYPNSSIQTEWQQPPSQPIYQQPFQSSRPPEKKTRTRLWIATGAVIALIAILCVAFVGHGMSSQTARPVPTSIVEQRQQPTQIVNKPSPLPTLTLQAIGKPIVVNSTWTITVNSVKTNAGDPFSTPAVGDTFLVVDVTVKNTSSHYQDMASGIQLMLKDSTGQQYGESITDFATPPDGSIKFGESLRGQLVYEIPVSKHTFFYYFQADSSGTSLTEWALNV